MGKETAKTRTRRWKKENLYELFRFLENIYGGEIDLHDFSSRTGISYANASSIFLKDDMKLSRVESIARAYGYELKLFFPVIGFSLNSNWNKSQIAEKYPNAGNLTGLIQYMSDRNITMNYMSQRIHHSISVLKRSALSGDIFLSILYEIINNLKINVIWDFQKINK